MLIFTSTVTPHSLSILCKINVFYEISKIQIAGQSLGHAIKAVLGPASSIISPEGSISINKTPCY